MLGVRNDCLREASLLRASERGKRTRGKHIPFLTKREVVTSRWHGSKISGPEQTEVLQSGGSQSRAFRTPFTLSSFLSLCLRLPPFIVVLLLSCKSRCLTPYSNRECFGLSKIKNGVVNRTTSHSPARSLKHNFTPRSKIFMWNRVVRSELPGRSPMGGFFPTTPKNTRPIKMVFDDILSDSLCCSYGEFRQLARQTRHWHDWHSRHTYRVYMCHAISLISYDVSDLEKFPISQKVMLFFFFFSPSTTSRFLTFLACKILL